MSIIEEPIVFECSGEALFGLLHYPKEVQCNVGVLIVVGGPQYRAGSHRQFVELARGLVKQGIAVFRFDCVGMGDSTGEFSGFESLDEDIRCAVDTFKAKLPNMDKLVIWGLCDGASAACFYAPHDERVSGLCLVNPWVRTEQGEAEAFVKHYYLARVLNKEFWAKVFTGRFQVVQAMVDFFKNVKRSFFTSSKSGATTLASVSDEVQGTPLPIRLFRDLISYRGKLMFVISGNDLTASEFMDSVKKERKREKLMASPRVTMVHLNEADHTFSRREWMQELVSQTAIWIKSL